MINANCTTAKHTEIQLGNEALLNPVNTVPIIVITANTFKAPVFAVFFAARIAKTPTNTTKIQR